MLLLYPLNPAASLSPPLKARVVMGLAISFPASDTAEEIIYRVNRIYREDEDDDA